MVTVEEIRRVALALPRTEEALVRDRIKFRVGRIVYVALSRDETTMGCGFPREQRAAAVAAEPSKFFLPIPSEMRYQWIEIRMSAIDVDGMRELVTDAWRMVVPKRVAAEHLGVRRDHVVLASATEAFFAPSYVGGRALRIGVPRRSADEDTAPWAPIRAD